MHRPIPPPIAWQAIAAFAGFFTLVSALADPVDLWRLNVLSRQGEPLRAVALLETLPHERITQECLSLGSESDAPGGDAPFLKQARLSLNATGNAVEITTDAPVSSPALELVLRVQCPGTFLYARHFSILIPPQGQAIAARPRGFRLKVGSGETVESLAASVLPGNRKLQRQLAREVVAYNPEVFPDGKPRPVPAGTVLFFPELKGIGSRPLPAPAAIAARPAKPPPAPRTTPVPAPAPVQAAPVQPQADAPVPASRPPKRAPAAPAGGAVRLRRALELGEVPGPQECRLLLPLCGVSEAPLAVAPPDFERRASGLETGMQSLKLKQESIDSQLSRLEQSLAQLQRTVETRAAAPAPPPAIAPKPEIRTVVKTEYRDAPVPWYFWLVAGVVVLAAAAGGYLAGRRRAYGESLAESDERLDQMLASAAHEIRDLERVPPRPAAPVRPTPMQRLTPAPDAGNGAVAPDEPEAPQPAFEKTQVMQAVNVDVPLDAAPAAPAESAPGVTTDLAFEMDQALDNTRSMFTDVDRFIALGRTQNALSLLQFQVVKDPKDRDSWIKLLAIYRQEKMDAELDKTLREFRKNFPGDKALEG